MKLLIVESPAKAKTISKYLDNKYLVKASVGHIRDLPKNNKKAVDIENGFTPHYEISKGKEKIVEEIKELSKKASEVILATDPDREGEAIAWHIKEAIGLKKPKRVVFHEITRDAINEAMEHPRDIDMNLKEAQETRRVLDRLFGYDLSGLIWKKVRYGLSAGRVQSPALRIIVEREREIRDFKPETYFNLKVNLTSLKIKEFKKGSEEKYLTFNCVEEPKEKKEVDRIVSIAKKEEWKVIDIEETKTKRTPRAPFTTSTLQQTASSRLGFSPANTMRIAQKLYEAGYITYMRTDSVNLSQQAIGQASAVISSKFGKEYSEPKKYETKSKNAQEAHEAVRPTDFGRSKIGSGEAQKLYELIWQRAIASQMSDAQILRTKISANVSSKSIPDFAIIGNQILFDGWLRADPEAVGDEISLPNLDKDSNLDFIEIQDIEKQTEPPSRYTEAGLVKELEKRGIGRPSTYASTIKTIQDRGYVQKENRSLKPTDTGEVVSKFLEDYFGNYISDSFTAEMEDKLDDIALGKAEYESTLKNFYNPFKKEIKSKDKIEKITNLGPAPDEFKCPICQGDMIIKLGRNGKFLSCSKYPDCAGARTIDGKEMAGPKEIGENCPECKDGKLVLREGRYGEFVSCSNYPKCKYIKKDFNSLKNSSGVKCPSCKEGEIVERRGRFGFFWSCTNYPKCKFAMKAKPTGRICNMCNSLMMEGTKTIPERCSNKECPNHNPQKLQKK